MRVLVLTLFVAACGSSDTCKSDEVEVDYLGGPRDGESHCVAAPAVCGNPATCEDTCRGAMYSLCESPYNGVGCSDTFAPPIISCNP
ncbi:MAG: hypothetical protein ABI678_09185 [Kofleriaceae bacterium]